MEIQTYRTKSITVRFTEKEINEIKELSNHYNASKSNLIRSLIHNHYKELKSGNI